MSGCLIFQRPDICSTTSLESIRTSTSSAPSSAAAVSPAIRPRYSATLLVATPDASLALGEHASDGRRRTPPRRSRPAPGCPANRRRLRRHLTLGLTVRTPWCAPGSRRTRRNARRPRRVAAAIRAISPRSSSIRQAPQRRALQQRRADAGLLALLLVERQQVLGQRADQRPRGRSRHRCSATSRSASASSRRRAASVELVVDLRAAHRRARGRPRTASRRSITSSRSSSSAALPAFEAVRARAAVPSAASRRPTRSRASPVALLAHADRVDLAFELADVAVEVVRARSRRRPRRPCARAVRLRAGRTFCCSGSVLRRCAIRFSSASTAARSSSLACTGVRRSRDGS